MNGGMSPPSASLIDLGNLDARTKSVENALSAETISFSNVTVSGSITDSLGNAYVKSEGQGGNVQLQTLTVTDSLHVPTNITMGREGTDDVPETITTIEGRVVVPGSLVDDENNLYVKSKGTDGRVEFDTVRVTESLEANVFSANSILSNDIRTSDGLSFLRLAFGKTGTGREDPATISVRSEGFRDMVVDGDFVQVNGSMKGNGKFITSFAERENQSLESRLTEYAKFSDRRVFVSATDGDDSNHGRSWDQAVRTIKRACEIAEPRTTIFVASGDYYEEVPIYVKPNVSIIGDSLRTAFLYTKSWEFRERDPRGRGERAVEIDGINYNRLDYFHVDNAVYLYGLRFKHLQSPGYCVAFPCAIVDTGVNNGGLSNPNSPQSDTLPVLYSPEGYYTDPRPQAGPFYEWERDSTGETDRFKNARITQVVVSNSGVGYSVDTRIDIDAPDVVNIEPNAGTRARARVRNVDANGGIREVEVTDSGRGYNDEAREQRKNVSAIDGSGFGSGALLSPVYTSESYVAWSEEAGTKRPAGRVFSAPSSVEVTTSLVRGIAAYVERRGSTFPKFARRNPGSYFDVADTIAARRDQYQDRVLAFVSEAFPNLLNQEQQVLCRRDVGLIVDAVVSDLRRGGYDASLQAAQSYFVGGASVLSEGTVRPTVRAIETLADALKRSVLNEVIETYPYQRNEGYTSQRRYRALTGDVKYDADRLFPDIKPNFPESVLRDTRAYPNEANALQDERDSIVDETMTWASEQAFSEWTLLVQERLRRDIRRWIDAVVFDLRSGGALASVRVAESQFFRGERILSDTVRPIFSNSLEEVETRVRDSFAQTSDGTEKAVDLVRGIRRTLDEPLAYDPPHIVLKLGVPAFLARFPIEAQTQLGGFEVEARYLEQQRETIQNEVMTFVQNLIDSSEGAFNLQPDQLRLCRRDTGLIVDSLVSDLRTGGCSRMVESANAYYVGRSTTRVFDDDQIDPTISAIRFIRDWIATRSVFEQSETALRTAHLLLEGIVLTLRVPAQTKRLQVRFATLDSGGTVDTQPGGFTDAADTLLDERSRLQNEVVEWVDRFFPELFVDASLRSKCSRDVGLIVDALAQDLRFGGAKRIEEASIAYYRGRASVLPEAQRSPTIQAIRYLETRAIERVAPNNPNLANILSRLILTLTNTIDEPDFTGGINPAFEASVQNETRRFPQTASFFGDLSRIESLQDDVMTYVETEFPNVLDTDALKEKCRRDVGFVVNAIVRDLDEAGFVRCAYAASKYYEGMERLIPTNQLQPTIAALEHLEVKMKDKLRDAADEGTSFEDDAKSRISGLLRGIVDTLRKPLTMEQNDFPRPVRYVAYQLVDANLSKWRIEGSEDGNTWTTIDSRDLTASGTTTVFKDKRFGIAHAGRYTHYRLVMLQNRDNRASGEGFMHVTQIRFFEPSPPQVYVDGPDNQNTKVRSIDVQSSGSGYSENVKVSLIAFPGDDPPSKEAQVETVVKNGRIQNIFVLDGGRGYQGRANVVIEDLSQFGSGAQAIAIMEDDYARAEADEFDPETGKITRVRILDRGSGYVNPPTVSITAPEPLRPIVTASPYVQNCSNISGPWDTTGTRVFETHPLPFPLDDIYQDPNDRREIDPNGSGGGIRIDGASPRIGSPLRSFVVDAFTQVNQGGVGFLLTNLAYAQFVSTFGTFCSTHMRAIGGSFANASNSVTDFGTTGLEAKGYWPEPFSRGRCIAPGDPEDPTAPTSWETGSGMFVPNIGYRSDLVNVTIETDETFDADTDRLFVEISPPLDDDELVRTAQFTGSAVFEDNRRRVVELNNEFSLSQEGELENLVLDGQVYPSLGFDQATKRFRGVGYKSIPTITLRKNDAFGGQEVTLNSANVVLSNVSTIRVAILEGRRPDFLSIARIHGEWYTVQGVNPVSQVVDGVSRELPGYFDVLFFPAPPYVDLDHDIDFHSVSYLSTGSHVMEYVGSGITYNALPEYGGIPDSGTETVETAPAKVFYTTSDQLGNSKVGPLFEVNQATGQIALDATSFDLRNLAGIGPFVRNGVVVGQQIREVSNNPELRSSLGAPDAETVPTQSAVASYVQRRSVPTPTIGDNGKFLRADLSQRDAQGRSFAWQNLNLNDAVSIDIQRVILNTDVLTGLYIDGEARVYGDVLCDQFLVTDPQKDVRMPFGSLVVRVEDDTTDSETVPKLRFRYRNKKGKYFRASLDFEPEP